MATRKTKKKASKKKAKKSTTVEKPFKLRKNVRMDALNPAKVPRVRKELVDIDYIKQLSLEEKRWLAQFTDEYVSGSVKKDSSGRVKPGYLHKTKELAKDCYDNNNRRNNDVHSVTKANGLLYNIDQIAHDKDGWYITNAELTEDALITVLEKKEDDSILSFEEFMKLKGNLTPEVRSFYEKHYATRLK